MQEIQRHPNQTVVTREATEASPISISRYDDGGFSDVYRYTVSYHTLKGNALAIFKTRYQHSAENLARFIEEKAAAGDFDAISYRISGDAYSVLDGNSPSRNSDAAMIGLAVADDLKARQAPQPEPTPETSASASAEDSTEDPSEEDAEALARSLAAARATASINQLQQAARKAQEAAANALAAGATKQQADVTFNHVYAYCLTGATTSAKALAQQETGEVIPGREAKHAAALDHHSYAEIAYKTQQEANATGQPVLIVAPGSALYGVKITDANNAEKAAAVEIRRPHTPQAQPQASAPASGLITVNLLTDKNTGETTARQRIHCGYASQAEKAQAVALAELLAQQATQAEANQHPSAANLRDHANRLANELAAAGLLAAGQITAPAPKTSARQEIAGSYLAECKTKAEARAQAEKIHTGQPHAAAFIAAAVSDWEEAQEEAQAEARAAGLLAEMAGPPAPTCPQCGQRMSAYNPRFYCFTCNYEADSASETPRPMPAEETSAPAAGLQSSAITGDSLRRNCWSIHTLADQLNDQANNAGDQANAEQLRRAGHLIREAGNAIGRAARIMDETTPAAGQNAAPAAGLSPREILARHTAHHAGHTSKDTKALAAIEAALTGDNAEVCGLIMRDILHAALIGFSFQQAANALAQIAGEFAELNEADAARAAGIGQENAQETARQWRAVQKITSASANELAAIDADAYPNETRK